MCVALFHVTNNADGQAREAITSVSHCLSLLDSAHFRSAHQFNWGGINFYPVLSVRVVTWKYRLTRVSYPYVRRISDVAVLTSAKRIYGTFERTTDAMSSIGRYECALGNRKTK